MKSIFKLYPWEAMLHEEFGPHALATYREMNWVEPIWKMLLANKGILPVLWQMYPGHPLLLPAYFEDHGDRGDLSSYVRKPLLSREGANVSIVQPNAQRVETPGPYGDGRLSGRGWRRRAFSRMRRGSEGGRCLGFG